MALGWGCSEEVEVAAAYVALCLRCRPVSMTRATLRAGPAIPGGAQYPLYPLPHGDWDRWCRLKRFCMPRAPPA